MKFNTLPKIKQQEISEVLQKFGLDEKEQALYFALLSSGRTGITPLARQLSFPLTTVQSVLERLRNKGLVTISKNKSRQLYIANDPSELKAILERQIKEVTGIIPMLKDLVGNEKVDSKVRVYYKERMADIFHDILTTSDKMVHEIVSAQDLQLILGEKFHFTKRRVERGIRLKSLRVEACEIKKYNKPIHEREMREAKFLPTDFSFKSSIFIWDDKVAIFSAQREGLALVVESPSISLAVKQIFDLLWSVSRRMETL